MGMKVGDSSGGPMADINVTPLVDVVLVLLIIFMVTAPLLVTGVPVNLPETRAKGLDQDAKPTVVSIDRDGGLFIDDAQISDDLTPTASRPRPSEEVAPRCVA